MSDVLITMLTDRCGDQIYIMYSPSREKMVKFVCSNGKRVTPRNVIRNVTKGMYRQQIKGHVKWGCKIESTSETDFFEKNGGPATEESKKRVRQLLSKHAGTKEAEECRTILNMKREQGDVIDRKIVNTILGILTSL